VPEPLFLRRFHEGMSTRANPTAQALTGLIDPHRPPVRWPQLQLLRGYLGGIGHAQLSNSERALSYVAFVLSWARTQTALRTRTRKVLRRASRARRV
jgi:hypothetical protein